MYQHDIILFCNYYGAFMLKMFVSLCQFKKKFVNPGGDKEKTILVWSKKKLLWGEKS